MTHVSLNDIPQDALCPACGEPMKVLDMNDRRVET